MYVTTNVGDTKVDFNNKSRFRKARLIPVIGKDDCDGKIAIEKVRPFTDGIREAISLDFVKRNSFTDLMKSLAQIRRMILVESRIILDRNLRTQRQRCSLGVPLDNHSGQALFCKSLSHFKIIDAANYCRGENFTKFRLQIWSWINATSAKLLYFSFSL